MRSVASVGECMLELSGAGQDWRMNHAGDAFNMLWTMRALLPADVATDFVSAFGDDPFSADQLAFMARAGIGTAESPRISGARPGLYAIMLDGAERSFTYWRSDSAARRLADDPVRLGKSLAGQTLVYFSGITLAILEARPRRILLDAIASARAQGSLIAFDPNYRPRLWQDTGEARSAIAGALEGVDIALPTFVDEHDLFNDASPPDTAERLARAGVGEIAVKAGSAPSLLRFGGTQCEVAGVDVATPVDTTGAGDAFNGGYLAARLTGYGPVEAARKAHAVAAAVIQVHGALAPFEVLRAAFEASPQSA